jgi:uncharacterized protein YkwD
MCERTIEMRFLHFLFISVCLVVATCSIGDAGTDPATPAEQDFGPYESLLLEKINWARSHPVEAATAVGIDSNQLLLESAGWRSIVAGELPQLRSNEALQQSARQHTQDMVANHYYGYVSPDGQTAEARIGETGYDATVSGEMLGLIAFNNFMSPEIAVQNLFEQLLKRDLRSLDTGKSNIYNSSLQDVGIAMMAGVSHIGGLAINAYVLTCDFATSSSSVTPLGHPEMEYLFLDMMNRVRLAPMQAFETYGIDMTMLTNLNPALMEILTNRLPPLVYSPSLRETASKRNAAVFTDPSSLFTDELSDVVSYDHCTEPAADCPAVTGETLMRVKDSQNLLPSAVVQSMFRELLIRELNATDISQLWILSPNIQEIGITLEYRQRESAGAIETYYVLANAYGRDYRSKLEKQSLNLLNQARAAYVPASVAAAGSEAEEWHPIPPLIPHHTVYTAADAHSRDMIAVGYFDTYSDDGTRDSSARLFEIGYPVVVSDETIEMMTSEEPFDADAAGISIFDNLLAAAVPSDQGPQGLLNPVMKTAGIRFLYSAPVTPNGLAEETPSCFQTVYSLFMVADVAAPSEPTAATLVGLVFQDKNGDGRYNRDEELASTSVTIRNAESSFQFYTDTAGNVSIPLSAGTYEVEVEYDGVLQTQTIEIGSENTLLLFPF